MAALLDGHQVTVFRTVDGMLHAVDDRDPFTGRNVPSRGIVGTRAGARTVASPLLRRVFDSTSGRWVSAAATSAAATSAAATGVAVRVVSAVVPVRLRPAEGLTDGRPGRCADRS